MSSEKPTIQCSKNGPYLVKGLAKFTNSYDEQIPTRATIALCWSIIAFPSMRVSRWVTRSR